MATLNIYGPFSWVQPRGQNGLLPGEEHAWFAGDFTDHSLVFQASAHPARGGAAESLAVVDLRTTYRATGGPVMNFVVRNVGSTGVSFYNVFVTGTGF